MCVRHDFDLSNVLKTRRGGCGENMTCVFVCLADKCFEVCAMRTCVRVRTAPICIYIYVYNGVYLSSYSGKPYSACGCAAVRGHFKSKQIKHRARARIGAAQPPPCGFNYALLAARSLSALGALCAQCAVCPRNCGRATQVHKLPIITVNAATACVRAFCGRFGRCWPF